MKSPNILDLEKNLTRQSTLFIVLAVVYGIVAGAIVTMYYDVVPDMGNIEDNLTLVQAFLYLAGVLFNLIYLSRSLWEIKNKAWKNAVIQAGLALGPLLIFVGSDGLISHSLWWDPLSDTDRFHMLHHSLIVGAPLTLLYWLAIHRWWVPANVSKVPKGKAFPIISTIIVLIFSLGFGVMFGSPGMAGLVLAGLLVSVGLTVWSGSR